MKKLIFTFLFLASTLANAQYYQEKTKESQQQELSSKSFWERVHFGGGLAASFGSFTSVMVAPNALYEVTPNFMAGVGLNYIYLNQKITNLSNSSDLSVKSSIYGGKILAYYTIFDQILLSGEFEHNYRTTSIPDGLTLNIPNAYWKSALFVGLGYMVPFGNGGGIIISLSYDLLYDENLSIFGSPFRPGIGVFF